MDHRQPSAAEIGRRAAEEVFGIGRHGARHLGHRMREAAEALIDEQKDRAADAVSGLAATLRQASHQLEREEKPMVARYADQAAARVEQFSATMRAREVNELLLEVERFARRQPALFFTSALAAGFLLGRVLSRPSAPSGGGVAGYAMTGGERAMHTPVSPGAASPEGDAAMAGYGPTTGIGPA
jgi:hypothetical protein